MKNLIKKSNLISVIVPIYNVELYLDQCITSILNQTYKNLQVILVNDGSTDRSLEICNKYKDEDSRVIVVDIKNSGVTRARKEGFKLATGDYISFIDSDDYMDNTMYEYMNDIIARENVDFVQIGFNFTSEIDKHQENTIKVNIDLNELNNIEIIEKIYIYEELKFNIFPNVLSHLSVLEPYLWNKLLSYDIVSEHINKVNDSITFCEDRFLVTLMSFSTNSICISNNKLYTYRDDRIGKTSICDTLDYSKILSNYNLYFAYKNNFDCSDETIENNINNEFKIWGDFVFRKGRIGKTDFNKGNYMRETFPLPIWKLSYTKNIIIYGANEVGISNYLQLKKISNASNIKLVDESRAGIHIDDILVESPNVINNQEFNIIIICGVPKELYKLISNHLCSFYNVDSDSIIYIEKQLHTKYVIFEEVI